MKMELVLVDKSNYQEAIEIQKMIFPEENGTLNVLASLDRELFIKVSGLEYIDDHVKYYLARVNNEYIGITELYYYGDDLDNVWIAWYGILEEYRNKGLGKEILLKTIELAKSKNFKYLRLYTDPVGNHKAMLLYERMGFIGEEYTAEELPFKCLIYSMSLDGSKVPLWNNEYLDLCYQSILERLDDNRINEIYEKFKEVI